MGDSVRPRVVVSRCLGFAPCRWNGQTVHEPLVDKLTPFVTWQPVCPEMEIGLGVPRDPVRVVEQKGQARLVQPATGRDCTAEMLAFSQGFLEDLPPLDGFLLKSRSPSCGPRDVKIYSSPKPGASSRRGPGFFGGAVLERFPGLAVEHEGRLNNFLLREAWLTRLFTLAEFRQAAAQGRMGPLVAFHSRHKLLLMAYNQRRLRLMGPLVANQDKRPAQEVLAAYGRELGLALARAPSAGAVVNVLMHAEGYFKKQLNAGEKKLFSQSLEQYRAKKLPLSALLTLLRSWIARFGQEYLAGQSFFAPYPPELSEISDSGKGRDL
ncbi:MAG: DUF523 and DUF1722 domain-containing protein [Desulfarculaceae bacterium]|nr:DUF523 and DUF1722 domain-containing protein [Desulfarculaceae bacterium]MCF8071379.1 DUF523 and DUF1722 domain-containing protein [Desulfarculaceae bacterium]MCF8101704.1 DUF523 and DUF1722 domain-containing protein [Desulfarculaceae bacterium]MCF8116687.1 DUF523 and DUF1722 domain-containing protein [Desulfarculaceae bacterium]